MRLLVDASVLIALVDGRLDARIKEALTDPDAAVHASVASLWEIAIKVRLGKLALNAPLARLPELVAQMGITVLAIEAAHVITPAEPAPQTRDPFDRLLLAQCMVENLRLVTIDRQLTAHPFAWRPH